ncbi:ubiquinol-cytochrome c reductase iron-sulfur subunit [Mesorhizobium sp. 43Arga]
MSEQSFAQEIINESIGRPCPRHDSSHPATACMVQPDIRKLEERRPQLALLDCRWRSEAAFPSEGVVIMTVHSELESGSAELALPAGALTSIEIDVSSLTPGMSLIVQWRGKPLVVRNRTRQEMKDGEGVNLADLKDPIARNANLPADAPATDANRTAPGQANWLVMVQVCTHLGCIPLGQDGEFGGWLCPCHGSQYDSAGRIRKGPAPENMAVPVFQFVSDTKIRVG